MQNKEEENKIRQNLEEQFKGLLPEEDAPQELKEEVFNTIDTLSLIGDIVDLFTTKFSHAETAFLQIIQEDESDAEGFNFLNEPGLDN